MSVYRVKDWAQHQHYRHRRPPWIKLKRTLLEDARWHALPVASRALAPMLWLLASETAEGEITADSSVLAFRLRMSSAEVDEAIKPLISGGWLIIPKPETILLAPCSRDATSEFRDQSTDTLTQNHTDPARDAAPERSRSAPRANPPRTNDMLAALAAKNRKAFMGNA